MEGSDKLKMKISKTRKGKFDIMIALFLSLLVVTMPMTFSALQPEIDLAKGEIKQNPVIDTFASILSKIVRIFDIVPSVSAQELGCCPETKTGAKFQVTTLADCKYKECEPGQATDCWHKNETCRLGCCIGFGGRCFANSFREGCVSGSFIEGDAYCMGQPECIKKCCVKGLETFMATNASCFNEGGIIDESATTELECLTLLQEATFGCCKSYAGCEYITEKECKSRSGSSFYAGEKCYPPDKIPGCDCKQLTEGKCVGGMKDLYRADSCGNVYIHDPPIEKCSGYCDLLTNSCKSGDCSRTYRNNVGGFEPKMSNKLAKNGEAWCVYDTRADSPYNEHGGESTMGSRHWRHYCLYGKEYVEPCADYRQEICLEDELQGVGYGKCVENLWGSCLNISSKEECNANPFCFWWDEVRDYSSMSLSTLEDIDNWVVFGTKKEGMPILPLCLARYPPGLDDGINGFKNREEICGNLGSYICQYKQSFWGLDTENKECVDKADEFYTYMAHRCKSLGDCGSYFNWVGKRTSGFDVTQFDEMPENGSARGKKQLGLPDPYATYLADVESKWNEPTIRPRKDFWGGLLTVLKWVAFSYGGLLLSTNIVAAMSAAVAPTGLVLGGLGLTLTPSLGATTFAAGSTIPAGTTLAAGSSVTAGTFTSGTFTVGGQTVTASASAPVTITTQEGNIVVTGGSLPGSPLTTNVAPTVTQGSTATASTPAVAGESGAKVAVGGAPILGILMIIAGVIMLVLAFNQPPGFMQGMYFSLGTGFTLVGVLVVIGAIPGVGWIALAAAVITAIVVAGVYYWSYDEKFYLVQCNPSTPPFGGDDCEKCNDDPMRPCSKYRCESLGTACKFVDQIEIGGTSYPIADGKCVARENTGRAPWITELEVFDVQGKSVFKKTDFGKEPVAIDITMDSKPIPDSTSLDVKIKLNDDAICRWDYYSTLNITDMDFPYESTVLRKEMTQRFFVRQNMSYIHVRCADVYGNANVAEYVFRFVTTTGPDMTPPTILGTDRDYYKKFAYGTIELPLFIYVSEAATCKWSKQDTSYDLMTSPECKTTLTMGGFRCDTNLTGLQQDIVNYFYIRCRDMSEQKNAMQESYQLTLQPSPALVISAIEPADGSVIESCAITGVDLIVVTNGGAEEGKATCSWSNQGYEIGMQKFSQTGSTVHSVELPAKSQTVYIRCYDSALNVAKNSTSFTVYDEEYWPRVTRIYKDSGSLVIRTDEKATCTYHFSAGRKINDCNFAANDTLYARQFSSTGGLEHRTEWDDEPWYVKCYDECNNQGECVVIYPQELG